MSHVHVAEAVLSFKWKHVFAMMLTMAADSALCMQPWLCLESLMARTAIPAAPSETRHSDFFIQPALKPIKLLLASFMMASPEIVNAVLQAKLFQSSADLSQLANLYLPAVLAHTQEGPLLLCGVGICTMLAYELSSQLQQHRRQARLLLAAASLPVSLARQAIAGLHTDSPSVSGEMLQIWCALYQQIAAASRPQPSSQPPLVEVIPNLHSLPSYEQQLDYVGTFCPADKTALQWDTEVDAVLARVLHMRQLLLAYQPQVNVGHQTVLLGFEAGINEGGAWQTAPLQHITDDSWEAVASVLFPARACSIAAGTNGVRAAEEVEALLHTML